MFSFLFFRLNYLLKLNVNFLIVFLIVLVISFFIFKKIKIFSVIITKSNITSYIFYNFIIFKEYFYELVFTEFQLNFTEKLMIFYSWFNLGALMPLIFYNNIDYVLFNIVFFFFFFFLKILNMVENYIINKYFVKDDLISYENIKKKLNINNNLKFTNEKKKFNKYS